MVGVGKSKRRSSILKDRQSDTVTQDFTYECTETTNTDGRTKKNKRRVSFHSHKEVKHFDKALVEMNMSPVKEPMGDLTGSTDASKLSISNLSTPGRMNESVDADGTLLLFKHSYPPVPPKGAITVAEHVDMSVSIVDTSNLQDTTAALFSSVPRATVVPFEENTSGTELENSRRYLDDTSDNLTMNLFSSTRRRRAGDETNYGDVPMDISQAGERSEVGNTTGQIIRHEPLVPEADQTMTLFSEGRKQNEMSSKELASPNSSDLIDNDNTMALFRSTELKTQVYDSKKLSFGNQSSRTQMDMDISQINNSMDSATIDMDPTQTMSPPDTTISLFGMPESMANRKTLNSHDHSSFANQSIEETATLFGGANHLNYDDVVSMDVTESSLLIDKLTTVHHHEIIKNHDEIVSERDILTEVHIVRQGHETVVKDTTSKQEDIEDQDIGELRRRELSKHREIGSPMVVAKKKSKRLSGEEGNEKVVEVDTTIRQSQSMDVSVQLIERNTVCLEEKENGLCRTFNGEIHTGTKKVSEIEALRDLNAIRSSIAESMRFDDFEIPNTLNDDNVLLEEKLDTSDNTLSLESIHCYKSKEVCSKESRSELSIVAPEENTPSLNASCFGSSSRYSHDTSRHSDVSMNTSVLTAMRISYSDSGILATGIRFLDHRFNDEKINNITEAITSELRISMDEKLKSDADLRDECFAVIEMKNPRLLSAAKALNARKLGDELQEVVKQCRNQTHSDWYKMRTKVADQGLRNIKELEMKTDLIFQKRMQDLQDISEEKSLRNVLASLDEQAAKFGGINPEIMEKVVESQSEDSVIAKFMSDISGYYERRMKQHEWIVKTLAEMEIESVEDERRKDQQRRNRRLLLEDMREHDIDMQKANSLSA